MTYPFVSFIIPARNEEKVIARCLTAIKNLNYPHFDITVIDNGSRDRTSEIAESYQAKVLHEKIPNRAGARNLGWIKSHSEWIAFLDADCVVDPEWLRLLMEAAMKSNAQILQGQIIPGLFNGKNSLDAYRIFRLMKKTHGMNSWLTVQSKESPLVNGAAFIIRREALVKCNGFDEALLRHQDIDLSRRVFLQGGDVQYVPEARAEVLWQKGWISYLKRSFEVGKLKTIYNQKWNSPSPQPSALVSKIKDRLKHWVLEKNVNWAILALDEGLTFLGEYLNAKPHFSLTHKKGQFLSFIILPDKIICYSAQTQRWVELGVVEGHVLRSMSGRISEERLGMSQDLIESYKESLRDLFHGEI